VTDVETIVRLQAELEIKNAQITEMFCRANDMRKKIKRQRLENGRLNKSLSDIITINQKLLEQIRWMKGED
jgi:septal ring factor EnvC (AmiA/AmiB activator)